MRGISVFLGISGAVVLCLGVYKIANSEILNLSTIDVTGARQSLKTQILNENVNLMGRKIWEIDIPEVTQNVKKNLWVDHVRVWRAYPEKLVIEIEEKKPVAIVLSNAVGARYMDKNASLITEAKRADFAKYPILVGKSFFENKELRLQVAELISDLPKQGILSLSDIADISYSKLTGFKLSVSSLKSTVQLGFEDLNLKLNRARYVAEYLDKHDLEASLIDADFQKKVLVRNKKIKGMSPKVIMPSIKKLAPNNL